MTTGYQIKDQEALNCARRIMVNFFELGAERA